MILQQTLYQLKAKAWFPYLIISFIFVVLLVYLMPFDVGFDWEFYFLPATRALLSGQSPYQVPGFFYPPWLLLPMIPLSLLPIKAAWFILALGAVGTIGLMCYRYHLNPWYFLCILLSYSFFICAYFGQIDWLVGLGIFLPPPVGMFFVMVKPQVGIGIAIYWIIRGYQEGGIKRVFWIAGPIGLAFGLSFLIYGVYLLGGSGLIKGSQNVSFWPYSLPVGFYLLYRAIKDKNLRLSFIVGPLLSPYQAVQSWIIGFTTFNRWIPLVCLASWLVPLIS